MEGKDENSLTAEVNKIIKDSRPEFVAESMEQIIGLIPPSFDFIGFDLTTIETDVSSYHFATGKEVKSFLEEYIPCWTSPPHDETEPLWKIENLYAGRINQEGYLAQWMKDGISTMSARRNHNMPESCHTSINIEKEADGTLVVSLYASEKTTPEEVKPFAENLTIYERPEVESEDDNHVPDIKY